MRKNPRNPINPINPRIPCDEECKKEECCVTCEDRNYYGEASTTNNCNIGEPTEDECNKKFMKYTDNQYVKCIFTSDEDRGSSCDYYEPDKKETIQYCPS